MGLLALISLLGIGATVPDPEPPDETPDPLLAFRGRPTVVDFPALDDLGQQLRAPRGWGYLQAAPGTVSLLSRRLAIETYPAVAYLDRHGNVLHRDVSASCRRKLSAGVSEFLRRRQDLESRLDRLWQEVLQARRRGRTLQELSRLRSVLSQGVDGYREVEEARARIGELDEGRRREVIAILATEGLITPSKMESELKALEQVCRGLPVETWIRRERARLRSGVVVQKRRQE